MKKIVCAALFLLTASMLPAQEMKSGSSANPVSDAVRNMAGRESKNLVAAAEEMPADKYSYKPTPQQMSFGMLVTHIAKGNGFLCSKLTSQAAPAETVSEKDGKDKLLTALKSSFDYCETALKNIQDSQLGEEVTLWGGRKANKATALIELPMDWADHYSQAAMYLRLNNLLPPTAKKAPMGKKGEE